MMKPQGGRAVSLFSEFWKYCEKDAGIWVHPLVGWKRPEFAGDKNPSKKPEVRAKIAKALKGIKKKPVVRTPEWRQHISEALRGKPKSAEHIAHIKANMPKKVKPQKPEPAKWPPEPFKTVKEWKHHVHREWYKRRMQEPDFRERARKHARARRERLRLRRRVIIERLGGVCYTCQRPMKRLELHHLYYPDGVSYKDKKPSKAWLDALKQAEKNPEIFILLCRTCHDVITALSYHPEIIPRIFEVLQKTHAYQAKTVQYVESHYRGATG